VVKFAEVEKRHNPGFNEKRIPDRPLYLDQNSPFSKGLTMMYYPINGGLYDAVRGIFIPPTVSGSPSWGIKQRQNGRYVDSAPDSFGFNLERKHIMPSGSSQTFTWLASKNTANSIAGMVFGDINTTTNFMWMNNTTNTIAHRRSNTNTSLSISGVNNDDHVVRSWFYDVEASKVRLQVGTQTSQTTIVSADFDITAICAGYSTRTFDFDGKFQLLMVHNRVLSFAETVELQNNPFQVLRSDPHVLYSIGAGAPPAPSNSAHDEFYKFLLSGVGL
jgi:hypothetical protein